MLSHPLLDLDSSFFSLRLSRGPTEVQWFTLHKFHCTYVHPFVANLVLGLLAVNLARIEKIQITTTLIASQMALPLSETIIQAINLGKAIQQRCNRAESDLKELNKRLRDSLVILNTFWKVIERGMGNLLGRQQQDIALLIDHLQQVFDRYCTFSRPWLLCPSYSEANN